MFGCCDCCGKFLGALATAAIIGGAAIAGGSLLFQGVQSAEAAELLGDQLKVGDTVTDFTLTDTEDKEHKFSDLKNKIVVLEWFNPGCPFVVAQHEKGPLKTFAEEIAKPGNDVVFIAVNSGAPGKQGAGKDVNAKAREKWSMKYPVALDEDGKVGRMFGATNTPHMFVIDKQGTLVYAGAIDNAPNGKVNPRMPEGKNGPGIVNYVKQAVEELLAGETVTIPETDAYGCNVKY